MLYSGHKALKPIISLRIVDYVSLGPPSDKDNLSGHILPGPGSDVMAGSDVKRK